MTNFDGLIHNTAKMKHMISSSVCALTCWEIILVAYMSPVASTSSKAKLERQAVCDLWTEEVQ